MKPSLKNLIIDHLREKGIFVNGGNIEDALRTMTGSKSSNISRRLRELEKAVYWSNITRFGDSIEDVNVRFLPLKNLDKVIQENWKKGLNL